ncbi:hypothetical protein Leryth_025757 [Lithospermum erythrorhizon]|nr:hypothetical protein Leryth_025757 [Lithospermum erythrorhizon]
MDFFKLTFRKALEPKPKNATQDNPISLPEEPMNENRDILDKSANDDDSDTTVEDDDDDFITNEVKRRLKELRRNSFMELIPEEEAPSIDEEEEEEVEIASNQWRDIEAEGRQFWSGFDAIYETYCERMLSFDRVIAQQLLEIGCHVPSTPLRRVSSTPAPILMSKKLASQLRFLSFKKIEEPEDENLKLQQPENDPYQDLETAYVAQLCLTWEAIHCQYTQMSHKISSQPEDQTAYNHTAQKFQQFQVLLQRFTENEPFEQGARAEIYARARTLLPKLLQVPKVQGTNKHKTEEESESSVLATDLIKILEASILAFHLFLKTEKNKTRVTRKYLANQDQMVTQLQQVQSSFEKKVMKLKELQKKKKNWKDKSWPPSEEDVEMLLALIDATVLSRVLRMASINTNQLLWCEQKMKKVDFSNGKFQRDPSPIMFPC